MRASRAALIVVAFLGVAATAAARDIPAAPQSYVLDEADWLSRSQESALSAQLLQFERESSNQILVAIFRSLDGEELADFSIRVAEAWGIGREGRNNGILLAVYAEERKFDIEVGYGLEGAVTDAIASEILDARLRPAFREERYAQGLGQAVADLMAASRGEYEGSGRALGDRDRDRGSRGLPKLLIFLPFLLIGIFGGRRGRRFLWDAVVISSVMSSGRGSRGGGFGGGGFRGGGGSFGGGGARGGW